MTTPNIARNQPCDIEAEQAVLGAMLMDKYAIDQAILQLRVEDFYKPNHGHIFDAIMGLHSTGEPVDVVTVADELNSAGVLETVGGSAYLLEIQNRTPSISTVGSYAGIVARHSSLRRLVKVGLDVQEAGFSTRQEEAAEAIQEAERQIFEIAESRAKDTVVPLVHSVQDSLNYMEMLMEHKGEVTGTPTGFTDLDKVLAGLQPSALYIVGARPGAGKTAFALAAGLNAAKAQKRVLFCSLEMSMLELTNRLICGRAKVATSAMKAGKLNDEEWARITAAVGEIGSLPFHIDDDAQASVMEIRAKARRLKSKHGNLDLVVVDYLQLMTGKGKTENRQAEVAQISRGLKLLARELEVPVVALSQVNRGLEQRVDKRPLLSDLRESGSLEQDADVVMFLYRDEMYEDQTPDLGMAEVIVAKHRSGPTATIKLAFTGKYTRFDNMATVSAAPVIDPTSAHRPVPVHGGGEKFNRDALGGAGRKKSGPVRTGPGNGGFG